jgi:hypothetical protein
LTEGKHLPLQITNAVEQMEMKMTEIGCPLHGKAVLDLYFLENRARLLEIASFLDRISRCGDKEIIRDDFRYRSFIKALRLVAEPQHDLTRAAQLLFSDLSRRPVEKAGSPATGAWKEFKE